jgi:hypothetical protein
MTMPAPALTDSERIANLESEVAELRAYVTGAQAVIEAASERVGLSGIGVTPLPRRESRPHLHGLKALAGGAR